ncbi:MAG: hypothetical protein ABJN26_15760 [Stappiaceae bacterium]
MKIRMENAETQDELQWAAQWIYKEPDPFNDSNLDLDSPGENAIGVNERGNEGGLPDIVVRDDDDDSSPVSEPDQLKNAESEPGGATSAVTVTADSFVFTEQIADTGPLSETPANDDDVDLTEIVIRGLDGENVAVPDELYQHLDGSIEEDPSHLGIQQSVEPVSVPVFDDFLF